MTEFERLNIGWNADPNAPEPEVTASDSTLIVTFRPNGRQYHDYRNCAAIELRFENCSRYRITDVNDHGWHAGACRFSKLAPEWGEFYEIFGNTLDDLDPTPWIEMAGRGTNHFHFYFRDETLEVKARAWRKDLIQETQNGSRETLREPFHCRLTAWISRLF